MMLLFNMASGPEFHNNCVQTNISKKKVMIFKQSIGDKNSYNYDSYSTNKNMNNLHDSLFHKYEYSEIILTKNSNIRIYLNILLCQGLHELCNLDLFHRFKFSKMC